MGYPSTLERLEYHLGTHGQDLDVHQVRTPTQDIQQGLAPHKEEVHSHDFIKVEALHQVRWSLRVGSLPAFAQWTLEAHLRPSYHFRSYSCMS